MMNDLIGKLFLPRFLMVIAAAALFSGLELFAGAAEKIRVGFFRFDGYHNLSSSGAHSGYGYEYLQALRRYVDWEYEYVGYDRSWAEMLDMLKKGEIDILTSASKTPEREAEFGFSRLPIGSSSAIFSVRSGNPSYLPGDYRNWDGIRVGMLKENSKNELFAAFAAEKGFSYRVEYFDDIGEMLAALQAGYRIDAVLSGNLRQLKNEWVYEQLAPRPFYAIVRKDRTDLLAKLDYAVERLTREAPGFTEELQARYFSMTADEQIPYTASDRAFIDRCRTEKKVFRILMDPDGSPLSRFDDGVPGGLFGDMIELIARRTGLNFEVVSTPNRAAYLSAAAGGTADIVFDAWNNWSNAENNGYVLTRPYFSTSISRIMRKNFSGPIRTVALVRNSYVADVMLEHGLGEAVPVYYEDSASLVRAVEDGRQDAGFVSTRRAEEVMSAAAGALLAQDMVAGGVVEYAIGVKSGRADYLELFSVLDKAVGGIRMADVGRFEAGYGDHVGGRRSFYELCLQYPLRTFGVMLTLLLLTVSGFAAFWWATRRMRNYGELVGAFPLRFFVCDGSGRILSSSWGGHEFGAARRPLQHIDELPDGDVNRKMKELIPLTIADGKSRSFDFEYSGLQRTATITRLPDGTFHVPVAVWMSHDTSELCQARMRAAAEAERLMLVLRLIGDGVAMIDRSGRVVCLNRAAETLTGWTEASAVGQLWREVMPLCSCVDGAPLEAPPAAEKTVELPARGGRRLKIAAYSTPLSGGAGGTVLIFRDMTERSELRARFAEIKLMLECGAELTGATYFRLNVRTGEISGGGAIGRLLPVKDGRLPVWAAFVYPPDRGVVERAIDRISRHVGRTGVVKFRADHRGELRDYRMIASLESGESADQYLVGVVCDATAQTLMLKHEHVITSCLETLFKTADPLAAMQGILAAVAVHMDADCCTVIRLRDDKTPNEVEVFARYCTASFENFFETGRRYLAKPEWVRKLKQHEPVVLDDLERPEQQAAVTDWAPGIRRCGVRAIFLTDIAPAGRLWGGLMLLYRTGQPKLLSDMRMRFIRSVIHIMELLLKKIHDGEQMAAAQERIAAAEGAQGAFVASMSHEIRTPLSAVVGFAELLKDGTLSEELRQDYLSCLSSAGNALLALVNDVLDLSKLDAGQMRFTPVQTDFSALAAEAAAIFKLRCAAKSIRLELKIGDMPELFVDRQRMRQIIFNLIGNAVKFTDRGKISLEADFVHADAESGTLTVRVADTGCGIPEVEQKLVFQPFVQATSIRGTAVESGGTGLGLAIVNRMLERMNGSISLQSRLGAGSTFTVTLRNVRCGAAVADGVSAERTAAAIPAGRNVLIVDDMPLNRKVLAAMLDKLGAGTIEAAGGDEALKKFGVGVDLVLTDQRMPGMTGEELAAAIKQKNSTVPVILLTADTDAAAEGGHGPVDFAVAKPLTLEKLRMICLKYLSEKQRGI
ncbi:MAG: transporter substrate-binding domain-containing protein [Victivallaceae bacterium]|nr:transporter substrate-binding domain-containing protein [Victivallaceae bacterium]